MLTAVLALGSALVYGAGDFLGGLASRRSPVGAVLVTSQSACAIRLPPAWEGSVSVTCPGSVVQLPPKSEVQYAIAGLLGLGLYR